MEASTGVVLPVTKCVTGFGSPSAVMMARPPHRQRPYCASRAACVRIQDLPPGQTQDLWLDVGSESERLPVWACSVARHIVVSGS